MRRKSMPVLAFFFLAATVGQLAAGAQTPVTADSLNTPLIGAAPATPSATFAAPPPTAGISNAGRAGISNSAPLPTTLPSLSPTVVYVTQPPVETVTTGVPASVENTANNPATGAPSEVAPGSNESGGRTVNDMGPSYYADALPAADNGSLGELSAHYKALKGTTNARMLTNDDVQQMVANKNGVTVAKNMPPLGPGALVQSGQAQQAGSQPATQNAQSTSQRKQNAANGQGGTPPPAPSGVSAENSTTPQINQNQQSNDAQGSRRLPATATILPLLGLLGLLSGGIGFWFRKFRK